MDSLYSYLDNLYYGSFMSHYFFLRLCTWSDNSPLTNIDSINRQVELAKKYGIDGFCFYYYWFSGKKVLDEPLDLFLASDLKFSFHLMWANENWSKRWDGGNAEIILKQDLTEKDFDLFFEDILPYISDPRYEKIDNRPILAIYRPHLFQSKLVSGNP